jgi:XTP/dITP diphosphohydrolase
MKILIATNNPAKYKEIVAVLSRPGNDDPSAHPSPERKRRGISWLSLADLGNHIREPVEDGSSFADNAVLKARYYSKAAGMWALADDSGLEVDALSGEPGVHSAYYAREFADQPRSIRDPANNAKLIAALKDIPPERRTARFRCCLALADDDRILATAEGRVGGVIVDSPRGAGGFGYDPHFSIPSLGKTTAELAPEAKNHISHRGQALRAMRETLSSLLLELDLNAI